MKMRNTIVKKNIAFYILATAGVMLIGACSKSPSVSDVPAAPSGLNGLATGVYSVQLYWSDNSDNEDRFIIYRSVGGPYELSGETAVDAVSYRDEIEVSCVEASYYVVAENDGGQSTQSNRITVPLICVDDPPGEHLTFSR
jgi:hypothetical protein